MKKKKAIHIVSDEKFIDAAINNFSQTDFFEHHFYCLKKDGAIQHIRQTNKITIVNSEKEIIALTNKEYQVVFLHSLFVISISYLLQIRKNIRIVWLSWGADIYSDSTLCFIPPKLIHAPLFKDRTKKLGNIRTAKIFIKDILRTLFPFPLWQYKKIVQRIDYISTVLPTEYTIIKERNNIKAQYFFFRYVSDISLWKPVVISGNNILVGNSLDPTNNHIDLLESLRTINIGEKRSLVLPLNYAGNNAYNAHLKKFISREKQLPILPLWKFMKSEEYFKLIESCQYGIFGHIRQQAMGNIYQLLFNGAKIFMYEDSIAYSYLKSHGYYVYSIEKNLNSISISTPLSEEEKQHNKNLYLTEMNRKIYLHKLNESLKDIYLS